MLVLLRMIQVGGVSCVLKDGATLMSLLQPHVWMISCSTSTQQKGYQSTAGVSLDPTLAWDGCEKKLFSL